MFHPACHNKQGLCRPAEHSNTNPTLTLSISHRTIFFAPLDWGFGHTTRSIPLIRQLATNNKVILGVTPLTAPLLEHEFPHLQKLNIEAYNIRYSRYLPVYLKLLCDWPRITGIIKKERDQLQTIISEYAVDMIISDNRPGLYHPNIESIYITHQLNIQAGVWSGIANAMHHRYMRHFNRIWVPDTENRQQSLAGALSHSNGQTNVQYIGPQSRLRPSLPMGSPIDCLLLLSGPEPQRTILEHLFLKLFDNTTKRTVLVRGSADPLGIVPTGKLSVIDLADATQLSQLIADANVVVCRSGYSSLMDLHLLNKKQLVLVPTPGQTEQEYLALHWQKHFGAKIVTQNELLSMHPDQFTRLL